MSEFLSDTLVHALTGDQRPATAALAREVVIHRAAQRSDAERVRGLVRDAVIGELDCSCFELSEVDVIADRVAAELAPALSLCDLIHIAELVEYVETVTGLNSRFDPQDHADCTIKPAAWVALLRRLKAGADPALIAEARVRVKAEFEARKGGGR